MQAVLVAMVFLMIGGHTAAPAWGADCATAEQLTAEARGVVRDDIALAEQKLRRALELCPESVAIRYNLGILLYMQRQYGEARIQLEESVAIAPDYAPSLNALAFLLLGQAEEHPRALNLASQAVDLEVGNAEYLDTLARVKALESVGRGQETSPSLLDSASGPVLRVQTHPDDPPGSGVVLGGPGAAAVSRYLAGMQGQDGASLLVPVRGNTAAELVRAVGAEAGEVFHLDDVDRDGFFLVLAGAPSGGDMAAAKAQACRGRISHEVQPGDTLSIIAMRYYGDPSLWQAIYTCNRERVGADPGLLEPGSTLIIP